MYSRVYVYLEIRERRNSISASLLQEKKEISERCRWGCRINLERINEIYDSFPFEGEKSFIFQMF